MPEPTNEETENEFLERCMIDPEANEDFPNSDQRFAFCQAQWENQDLSNEEIKAML